MTASALLTDRKLRDQAHALLRQWLASDEAAMLASIDTLGASAIRAAADASGRLDRSVASNQGAEVVLANLQALATGLATPATREVRSLFRRRAALDGDPHLRIDALVQSLELERDTVARALITIDTDGKKLRAAGEALDAVLMLIQACMATVEAAARELKFDRPDRARFLSDTVAARLLAREQDVITQAAVTHQGVLTLQLLLDGQQALAQALSRARDTSVAALRTAIAARKAVAGTQDLARQAEALEQTARAAEAAPATRGDLQRVLADAVEQARRAIQAAASSQPGTRL